MYLLLRYLSTLKMDSKLIDLEVEDVFSSDYSVVRKTWKNKGSEQGWGEVYRSYEMSQADSCKGRQRAYCSLFWYFWNFHKIRDLRTTKFWA